MANKIKSIKMEALKDALYRISNELEDMNIYTIAGDRLEDRKAGKALQFGVNWAACGTCTVEETRQFAERLLEATKICETVNKLDIQDRTLEGNSVYTVEEYNREVETVQALLKIGQADFINMWFEKEVQ